MAVSSSTRLGLTLWSAGTDPFNRDQMQTSHQQLDLLAVGHLQGAARPAASGAYKGFLYLDTNTTPGQLSYCDGTSWIELSQFGNTTTVAVGDAATSGVAATAARSDHSHGLPAFGNVASMDGVGANGVALTFARSDHKHTILDDSITAAMLAPGAVGSASIGPDSVNTVNIVDNAVTNAKLGLDSVNGSRIADNSIDSEHYVDGSIDNVHLASGISATKIAAGTAGIDITGNAGTASTAARWTTARSVTFATGDVTGSFSIRGDANVSNVALTVANDSHSHTGSTLSAIPASDITAGTFGGGSYTITDDLSVDGIRITEDGTDAFPAIRRSDDSNTGIRWGGGGFMYVITDGSPAAMFLNSGSFGYGSQVGGATGNIGSQLVAADGEVMIVIRDAVSQTKHKADIVDWEISDSDFMSIKSRRWIDRNNYVLPGGGIRGKPELDEDGNVVAPFDPIPEDALLLSRAGMVWENLAEIDLHLVNDTGLDHAAILATTISKVQSLMDRVEALEG